MKARSTNPAQRLRLQPADKEIVSRWLENLGLARVARIVAALSDAKGARGRARRPEVALCLDVARLLNSAPDKALHSAALEIAKRAQESRRPVIEIESLTRQLERNFIANRHTYLRLDRAPRENEGHEPISSSGVRTAHYDRILSRLVDCLPTAIDLYDLVLAEAKVAGGESEQLVRSLGRARTEPVINEILSREPGAFTPAGPPARSLFELVKPALERAASEARSKRRLRHK